MEILIINRTKVCNKISELNIGKIEYKRNLYLEVKEKEGFGNMKY